MKSECCNADVFAIKKGNQVGIYCSSCGKWIKWANKNERRLIGAGMIPLKEGDLL